jgi:hypothetical protein
MKCQSCHDLLADDAQFCGSCGLPTSRHSSDAATQIEQHARPAVKTSRPLPLKWIAFASVLLIAVILLTGVGIAMKLLLNPPVQRVNNQTVNRNSTPPIPSSPVDLRGTWAGTYGPRGSAAKLTIKNHDGNSLDGLLEQGPIRVAFKGTYDSESRTLTMLQTEVLSGKDWSLGEDVGKLSPDGKRISGTGKDGVTASLGMTYQWSFTRK